MSITSTPSRTGSLGSTASSPRQRHEVNPDDLTPRTKVKVLLASLDMESDEEQPPTPKDRSHLPSIAPQRMAKDVRLTHPIISPETDIEEASRRPRGGLAARLQADDSDVGTSTFSEDDEPVGAYARIKKQLLASKMSDEALKEADGAEAVASTSIITSDASKNDVVHKQPRKVVQHRRTRSVSPDVTNLDSSSQLRSLFITPQKNGHGEARVIRRSLSASSASNSDSCSLGVGQLSKTAKKRETTNTEKRTAVRPPPDLRTQASSDPISAAESDDNDAEAASIRKRLTLQAHPARKAGKKALEEIQRETQRMSRNMQLGYREQTKKRFTTKDLFKRFNIKEPSDSAETRVVTRMQTTHKNEVSSMHSPSILGFSDAEDPSNSAANTAPTSPPNQNEILKKSSADLHLSMDSVAGYDEPEGGDAELPDLDILMSHRPQRSHRGKGRALVDEKVRLDNTGHVILSFGVKSPKNVLPGLHVTLDSDDEESTRPKSEHAFFDMIAPNEAPQFHSLPIQRALAHMRSSVRTPMCKRGARPSATPAEIQSRLRLKAHQQAVEAKRERIEQLRAKGLHIDTEEEKKEREEYVANSLQKAREEAALLAERERAESKGKGCEAVDMLSSDEDEEWYGDAELQDSGEDDLVEGQTDSGHHEEPQDPEEIESSGSSDDESGEVDIADDKAEEDGCGDRDEDEGNNYGAGVEDDFTNSEQEAEEELRRPLAPTNRQRRRLVVIDDEDDEELGLPKRAQTPDNTQQDDAIEAFGFDKTEASPVTMTQMFAGTMGDLGPQHHNHPPNFAIDDGENSLAFLRELPNKSLPDFGTTMPDIQVSNSQLQLGFESQVLCTQTSPALNLGLSQFTTPSRLETPSRFSEAPDPTQDAGFVSQSLPTIPHSTTDTVLLDRVEVESPIPVKTRGRLTTRRNVAAVGDDKEGDGLFDNAHVSKTLQLTPHAAFPNTALDAIEDAFALMQKAAKKKGYRETFDKQNSRAKVMMDEQAEESEDEYAGIGGASDDEAGEEDEEDRAMIDNANVKVDERKIAALHAEQARIENEQRINQLYNDITSGALRRRRGGNFELSDDEDDEADERRRRKQRDFARRTKALLADDNIGRLAENSKQQAFLHTLEDWEDEEDNLEFLDAPVDMGTDVSGRTEVSEAADTTAADADVSISGALFTGAIPSTLPWKRKAENMDHRRSNLSKQPRTESELKKTISDLIDQPILIPDSQFSDEDDIEIGPEQEAEDENISLVRGPRSTLFAKSTRVRSVTKSLALAEMSEARTNTAGVMAFQIADDGAPVFKVPALLRRATTSLSKKTLTSSTPSSGSTSHGVETGGATKRGGSKKSNIHYQAREAEKRRVLEVAENRRKDGVRKKVIGRASDSGALGRLFSIGYRGFK